MNRPRYVVVARGRAEARGRQRITNANLLGYFSFVTLLNSKIERERERERERTIIAYHCNL
jgi:hypothetical protein